MKLNKIILGIVMVVLLSMVAFGYSACDVDSNCYLYHEVAENETTHVNIQLTNEWGAMIVDDNMSQYYNQTYQYVYAFTTEGTYNYTANVYNDTDLLSANYEQVVVAEGTSYNTYLIWGFVFLILFILLGLISQNFILNVLGFVGCIGLFLIGLMFVSQILAVGVVMIISSILLGAYIGFK